MKLTLFEYFIFGLFFLFWIVYFWLFGNAFYVYRNGTVVDGTVTRVDRSCNKYSDIDLLIHEKVYSIHISSKECREGKYRIGQAVPVRWHPDHSDILYPDEDPRHGLYIVMGAMVLVLAINFIGKRGKRKSNNEEDNEKAVERDRTRRRSKRGKTGKFPLP
ncbi:hypothetical protein [Chitinophaga caseinilytica]|uniref:DUF3592 domain-containing protein n=1 Tax=Chitinophaga caseinilytica TaxID=2267521 RepID=A0ABZ2Z2E1_9BACT